MSHIYNCSHSIEEDRTVIDFENAENLKNDWLRVGDVHDGLRPLEDYPVNVTVSVPHADATLWDCYSVPGTRGLFSERFVQAVGNDAFRGLSLLPARLNEATYFFLRCDQPIDCFDRSMALFETFRCDSTSIKRITHFAFQENLLPADGCFCIPETVALLLTDTVVQRLKTARLKGLHIEKMP